MSFIKIFLKLSEQIKYLLLAKNVIADKFNEFLIKLGSNLASKIPPSNKNFVSYLPHISTIFGEKI